MKTKKVETEAEKFLKRRDFRGAGVHQYDTNRILDEAEVRKLSIEHDCDLDRTVIYFNDDSALVVENFDVSIIVRNEDL